MSRVTKAVRLALHKRVDALIPGFNLNGKYVGETMKNQNKQDNLKTIHDILYDVFNRGDLMYDADETIKNAIFEMVKLVEEMKPKDCEYEPFLYGYYNAITDVVKLLKGDENE